MPLNIGVSGMIKHFAKYNAKADKWFIRGEDGDVEIERPTFVVDFDNIATGWLRFREGQAPERVMDPSLDRAAPLPGEEFKRGFVVMAFSPRYFDGAAEFASASLHLANAIKDIYVQYEAGKSDNPGKLPVISCTGSQAMKDRYGTNYRPTLSLVQWVERPSELPDERPVEPGEVWQGTAAVAASAKASGQHVPPPAPKVAEQLSDALF